jgi:hypothetical protein
LTRRGIDHADDITVESDEDEIDNRARTWRKKYHTNKKTLPFKEVNLIM